MAHGTRYGLLTVAAISAAIVLQLSLVVLGMSALLAVFAAWFEYLRWIGVGYLVAIGIAAWRAGTQEATRPAVRADLRRTIVLRGFLVGATNPKTLLFYAAFLPQFTNAERPLLPQLLTLSATILVLGIAGDSLWALLAGRASALLIRYGRLRNRITGALLIGAGVGLAVARKT